MQQADDDQETIVSFFPVKALSVNGYTFAISALIRGNWLLFLLLRLSLPTPQLLQLIDAGLPLLLGLFALLKLELFAHDVDFLVKPSFRT